jgi:hypothetical protein
MWFEEVEVGERSAGMDGSVARGDDHHDWLGLQQRTIRLGGSRIKGDGPSNAHDLVDIRLELSRHSEIVHGRTEDNDFCFEELVD